MGKTSTTAVVLHVTYVRGRRRVLSRMNLPAAQLHDGPWPPWPIQLADALEDIASKLRNA